MSPLGNGLMLQSVTGQTAALDCGHSDRAEIAQTDTLNRLYVDRSESSPK